MWLVRIVSETLSSWTNKLSLAELKRGGESGKSKEWLGTRVTDKKETGKTEQKEVLRGGGVRGKGG